MWLELLSVKYINVDFLNQICYFLIKLIIIVNIIIISIMINIINIIILPVVLYGYEMWILF